MVGSEYRMSAAGTDSIRRSVSASAPVTAIWAAVGGSARSTVHAEPANSRVVCA
jgi:hypothetical protein